MVAKNWSLRSHLSVSLCYVDLRLFKAGKSLANWRFPFIAICGSSEIAKPLFAIYHLSDASSKYSIDRIYTFDLECPRGSRGDELIIDFHHLILLNFQSLSSISENENDEILHLPFVIRRQVIMSIIHITRITNAIIMSLDAEKAHVCPYV